MADPVRDFQHQQLLELLAQQRDQQEAFARQLLAQHLASTREILTQFRPEKLYQTYRIDGATYAQPQSFSLPNARVGGIYVHNPLGAVTVRVFLGQDATSRSEFDVAPGRFVRWPVNKYADVSIVTFTLSATGAGVVRIVLTTENFDPDEGVAA